MTQPADNTERKLDTSDELEKVLALAENVNLEMEGMRSAMVQAQNRWLFFIVVLMASAAGVIASTYYGIRYDAIAAPWSFLLVGASIITLLACYLGSVAALRQLKLFRRKYDTEWRTLNELSELVRSLESEIATSEQWSPLKRAEFRIRLSRIDVQRDNAESLFPGLLNTVIR